MDCCLDCRRVWIAGNREVECWVDDESKTSRGRGCHYIRVADCAGRIISAHAIVVGSALAQAGHDASSHVPHVQVVVTVNVAIERSACGDIESIVDRAAYFLPSRHKAAARRRYHLQRATFYLRLAWHRVLQTERAFRVGPRFMRPHGRREFRKIRIPPWRTRVRAECSESQDHASSKNN